MQNVAHGNELDYEKPANTTRSFGLNHNGFKLSTATGGDFLMATTHLEGMKVDVAGFSEINLDTNKSSVQAKMERAVASTTDCYKLQMGSSGINSDKECKPGGTVI